jgi:AraC family transcriptional regulator
MPARPPADPIYPSPASAGGISHSVFKTMSETEAKLERFAWLGDDLAVGFG